MCQYALHQFLRLTCLVTTPLRAIATTKSDSKLLVYRQSENSHINVHTRSTIPCTAWYQGSCMLYDNGRSKRLYLHHIRSSRVRRTNEREPTNTKTNHLRVQRACAIYVLMMKYRLWTTCFGILRFSKIQKLRYWMLYSELMELMLSSYCLLFFNHD